MIYQKLLTIQKSVLGLSKDSASQNYQYVSGSKVLNFIKPLMCEQGLILKQEVISIDNSRQDYATRNNPNKSEILSKVMMKFTWVDCETGEKDENLFGANGQNDWDKGVGSALTYAERYFLLKYFHIATEEDDIDAKLSEDLNEDPIQIAIMNLRNISTLDELKMFWTANKQFQKEKSFIDAKDNRKKQIEENLKQQ